MTTHTSTILLGAIVAAALLHSTPLRGEETVLLRYKFHLGQHVRYSVHSRDETIVQSGQVTEVLKSSQTSTKSYRVLSVDEAGNALIELTLVEEVQAEIDRDGHKLAFDSSAPDGPVPPEFIELKQMVGKPHMRIAASPTGEITGAFVLLGKISEAGQAMDVFLKLPEKPVAVGSSWNETFHVPVRISEKSNLTKNVRLLRKYRLRNVQDGLATIDIQTTVLTPIHVPEQQVQLIRRTPKETVTIDLKRGLIVEKTITLKNEVFGLSQGRTAVTTTQNHSERLIEPEEPDGTK